MGGSEKFPQPIEVVFNYWEFPVSKIGERLDEILRQGIDRLTSFIPWQGAESDISHSLPRFLVAATERRMKIRLIATPEVGVHFWNSGLPKDLISKAEVMAKDSEGKPIYNVAPPNAFAIPSLYSSDFSKRYFQFLSRLDGLLADVERISSDVKKSVQVSI